MDPIDAGSIDTLPRSLSASEEALVERSNAFGLELLRAVVTEDDRPFVLAIRERLSGTILCTDLVGDPSLEDGAARVRVGAMDRGVRVAHGAGQAAPGRSPGAGR